MTDILIMGVGLALGAAIVLGYLWKQRYTPRGMHLGPYVKGKSKTVGVKLKGKAFAFPHPNKKAGHVHALVCPTDPIKGTGLRLRYRIEGEGTWHPQEHPEAKGQITLMVQRSGDNWSGKGKFAFYRVYYAKPVDISAGEHELVARFDEVWSGVYGFPDPITFLETLKNAKLIHICFGGGSSAAHGVYASGPAQFTLISLAVM